LTFTVIRITNYQ